MFVPDAYNINIPCKVHVVGKYMAQWLIYNISFSDPWKLNAACNILDYNQFVSSEQASTTENRAAALAKCYLVREHFACAQDLLIVYKPGGAPREGFLMLNS